MLSTKRQPSSNMDSTPKYRAGKSTSRPKRPSPPNSRRSERSDRPEDPEQRKKPDSPPDRNTPNRSVVTITVGPSKRLFAAHESVLCASPFFDSCCRTQPQTPKRITLPDEEPEVLSCVLEYLYRGDYSPHLVYNKRRDSWELEDTGFDSDGQSEESTIFHHASNALILKDTAVYCAAEKYALEPLKRLAFRKQGLHCGIQCSTILSSARFTYANTPDTESRLRAHYLAMIIRSRDTFKCSGTMQMEMERGGKLFFDLFVAMVNHMDDTIAAAGTAAASAAASASSSASESGDERRSIDGYW